MRTFVVFLVFFAVVLVLLALGLTWKGLLHWTGELLLLIGILLAAKGISDVRREWTGRPGIWRSIKQKAQSIRVRAAAFLWARWNQVVQWDWLAKRLHLRPHSKSAQVMATAVAGTTFMGTATAEVVWGAPAAGGTIEERLAWLESHMADTGQQLRTMHAWRRQEVSERQAATDQERVERMAGDQRIRERMADLAGGGLKLQAWGVACLLAGTLMTAIW